MTKEVSSQTSSVLSSTPVTSKFITSSHLAQATHRDTFRKSKTICQNPGGGGWPGREATACDRTPPPGGAACTSFTGLSSTWRPGPLQSSVCLRGSSVGGPTGAAFSNKCRCCQRLLSPEVHKRGAPSNTHRGRVLIHSSPSSLEPYFQLCENY